MPVINSERELVGLITMKDVKTFFKKEEPLKECVKDFMTKELITINQYKTIEYAKTLMIKHGINSLPVIRNNKLIGIITTNDV
jgi:CBS domain-containing protein